MSSKNYWRRVIRQLDLSEYTAVSIDLLGFNRAPKPDVAYSYDDHVAHVRTTLLQLGLLNTQVTLVGHSMGALIAGRYATTYPELIDAIGLINPPIYTSSEQASSSLLATGPHYRFLLTSRYRGLLWATGRYLHIFPRHSSASREYSLQSVVIASEFLQDVEKLSVRSLLTIGTKDRWLYQKNVERIKLEGLRMEVKVDNTGHHAALTHSRLISGYIIELIS